MLLGNHHLQALASKKNADLSQGTAFPPNLVCTPSNDDVRRDFRHPLWTNANGEPLKALVEVVVSTRMERTAGQCLIGDLVYTLSLLPGEEVRLFTTDRRTPSSVDTDTFQQEFSLPTPGLFVRGGRDIAVPSLFREVTNVGGVIADELEGLAVSFIERLGSGIVPAVMNKVVAAQALGCGANASLPCERSAC